MGCLRIHVPVYVMSGDVSSRVMLYATMVLRPGFESMKGFARRGRVLDVCLLMRYPF